MINWNLLLFRYHQNEKNNALLVDERSYSGSMPVTHYNNADGGSHRPGSPFLILPITASYISPQDPLDGLRTI